MSIAPMIDWTYNHYRYFLRLLLPEALIYTEMQAVGAVLNNPQRALAHSLDETPLALQLGGSSPALLAESAKIAEQHGFVEVNLNLGCPSDKVQAGQFGACLMKNPDLVVSCLQAMKAAVRIPVTAKIRLGVDEQDSYDFFRAFVSKLVSAGIDKLIVHARKAWLSGLNPHQNRTIPPVNYSYVYQIKAEFPELPIVINGNIREPEAVTEHLAQVDGVMIGRLACDSPYALAEIYRQLYPQQPLLTREELLSAYQPYLQQQAARGAPLSLLLKPLFNLYHSQPGASDWKKKLSRLLQDKELDLAASL